MKCPRDCVYGELYETIDGEGDYWGCIHPIASVECENCPYFEDKLEKRENNG